MLAQRARSSRVDVPETEAGALVALPRIAQTPSGAPHRAIARGDLFAVVGLVMLSLTLFGPHILGWSTFVGSSDRLHNFLNMRQIAITALLPLCVLAAIFVRELFGAQEWAGPRTMLALIAGTAIGVVRVLLIDALAPAVSAALLG